MTPEEIAIKRINEAEERRDPKLDLASLELNRLPEEIGKLKFLKHLYLYKNKLSCLPTEIGELKNLQTLFLTGNRLEYLPKEIGELSNLTELYLGFNRLKKLPIEITYLKRLEKLILFKNFIRELPYEFINLRLSTLDLANNPLVTPPLEIVHRGVWAIKDYFELLLKDQEVFKLKEAKLLIVGQGDVGKTCLAKRLMNPSEPIDLTEKSTEGISINKWNINDDKFSDIQLNLWDFGGQEIYHATHQFFLTKRSLYLFVWQARTDDNYNYFDYWLNIIKLLSDNSPVIIIQNKIDERVKTIDEFTIRSNFPNVIAAHNVSALKGTGINDLIDTIKHEVLRLPHIGDTLPMSWVKVRDELEKLDYNYISYNEYLKICTEQGVDEEKAGFLSRYFHDLGIYIHFNDNPILGNTIFLKPDWATNAVYKLIDTKTIQMNFGKFQINDLKTIWNDYPQEKFLELIELMKKFELCFQIPDTHSYIIPSLLPASMGDFEWNYKFNSRFEYHYDFMPAGIITRFIVRMNDKIKDNCYWKNGVILKAGMAEALVQSDPFSRKLKIWIKGYAKKEFLYHIRQEIEHIHKTQNYPPVKGMLPCICTECRRSSEPYFHSYEILIKALYRLNKTEVQCQNSFENVDINRLLGDTGFKDEEGQIRHFHININNYEKFVEMKIENQNIYGGNQQFAEYIINTSSIIGEQEKKLLELINEIAVSEDEKHKVVSYLEQVKSADTEPKAKSVAKDALKKFFDAGIEESGKAIFLEIVKQAGPYLAFLLN